MKIKNRLYISAEISIILVLIIFSIILITSGRIAEENKKYELTMRLEMAISELDILTYDYLLHREKRMEQQWGLKYNSTKELLEKIVEEEELVKSIRADYITLGNLFSQVTTNYKKRQNLIQEGASQEKINSLILLEERLVTHLLIKSQTIITDSFRLTEERHVKARKTQELANTLTLILITIFTITITTTLFLIVRCISKPLDKLTKSARIIGRGNLKHKIDIKSKDEIGELAETFNQMRIKLKQKEELAMKDRNELLNNILNTFKGKFGNIAMILFKQDIRKLVEKNPRILKLLPKSLVSSLKREEKLRKSLKKIFKEKK